MIRFSIEFVFWEGGVLNKTARYLTNTQQGRVELHKCKENVANSLWKRQGRRGVNVNNRSGVNLYAAPVTEILTDHRDQSVNHKGPAQVVQVVLCSCLLGECSNDYFLEPVGIHDKDIA